MGTFHLVALFTVLVLLAIDWLQTLTIVNEPKHWYERNPVIRWFVGLVESPYAKRVVLTAYFLAGAALTVLVTFALYDFINEHAALVLLGGLAVAELICVVNNFFLGIEPLDDEVF